MDYLKKIAETLNERYDEFNLLSAPSLVEQGQFAFDVLNEIEDILRQAGYELDK